MSGPCAPGPDDGEEKVAGREAARAAQDAHDGRAQVRSRVEARARVEADGEGCGADEELGAVHRLDTATGGAGTGCGGGFESVRIAAARSTAIATALSPTSVRATVPTTPARSMRGSARN